MAIEVQSVTVTPVYNKQHGGTLQITTEVLNHSNVNFTFRLGRSYGKADTLWYDIPWSDFALAPGQSDRRSVTVSIPDTAEARALAKPWDLWVRVVNLQNTVVYDSVLARDVIHFAVAPPEVISAAITAISLA